MSDRHYIGQDLVSFTDNGTYKPVSRVTLMIDDENYVTAGDDTGMELVATCYHATQAMADALLVQFQGYEYRSYEAVSANLDPSAELGDGITAGGLYSVISRLSDDGSGYPSPSAPGEAETEDEYPTSGPMTQEINRQIASTRSTITKTAAAINHRIDSTEEDIEGLGKSYSEISQTVSDIKVTVAGKVGEDDVQSMIDVSLGKIELVASNNTDGTQCSIKLNSVAKDEDGNTTSTIEMSSAQINLTGLVTISSLKNGGSTEIDGSRITTGMISAERLELTDYVTVGGLSGGTTTINGKCITTGTISAERLELTDYVTVSSLSSGTTTIAGGCIKTGKISAERLELTDYVKISSLSSGGSTSIDGSRITTGTISAERLDLTDYVTVTSLGSGGTTTIDGSRITTGTISAKRLDLTGCATEDGLASGTTTIDGGCITTGTIAAAHLDLSGVATISSLADGTTTIAGGCIKTGTISAERLDLTGAITWNDLATDAKNQIYAQSTDLPDYIKSTYIDADQVESFRIVGQSVTAETQLGTTDDDSGELLGFVLRSEYGSGFLNYMQVYALDNDGDAPSTIFGSPSGCYARWSFDITNFTKTCNFSGDADFSSATMVVPHGTSLPSSGSYGEVFFLHS